MFLPVDAKVDNDKSFITNNSPNKSTNASTFCRKYNQNDTNQEISPKKLYSN